MPVSPPPSSARCAFPVPVYLSRHVLTFRPLVCARPLLQPADTLLSQINKGHGPTGSMPHRLRVLAVEAGFRGLFAGLGPRMVMTAGLVAGQFLMYDGIKSALGAPPGLEIHKETARG